MSEVKFSKQREAILSELKSRSDHPTADELYLSLKKEMPSLSLGTVYRNLSAFHKENLVLKLPAGTAVRFDGDVSEHYHLFCEKCERMYDLNLPVFEKLNSTASIGYDGEIKSHLLIFLGICPKCKNDI